jgi:UDP-N-acetylglucosamine 4-epimerase
MKVLVTGGAGFIGSNLTEALLADERITKVRVLDNFATGLRNNLEGFLSNDKFELQEGDIRNAEDCKKACEGIDAISHQAALGSVPRSIGDPQTSHNVNLNGFVNMLEAARAAGVTRMVYASSSSVYGDLPDSPKVETKLGKVLSPYASTKLGNEIYAESWSKVYNLQLIGFRYFNVFGPKQDPNGAYAAVIPLFFRAALTNESPTINGDGGITRDFTPIKNVVDINIKGMLAPMDGPFHHVVNVACGQTTSLLQLWNMIKRIVGNDSEPSFGPVRKGDILQSLADISLAKKLLKYQPDTDLEGALAATSEWYRVKFGK